MHYSCLVPALLLSLASYGEKKNTAPYNSHINPISVTDASAGTENDTFIAEKPFIRLYSGVIDNHLYRMIILKTLEMEEETYVVQGIYYLQGDTTLGTLYFQKDGTTDEWKADIYKGTTQNKPHISFAYTGSTLQAIYNGHRETWMEDNTLPSFTAYDEINYMQTTCADNSVTRQVQYNFAPYCNKSVPYYDPVFKNQQAFITANSAYAREDRMHWQHRNNKRRATDAENCISTDFKMYMMPYYIDSTVSVISDQHYDNLGNAHGSRIVMYHTFDTRSGKRISIGDILNTTDKKFTKYYFSKLKRQLGKDYSVQEHGKIVGNFYIIPTGIVFSYASYSSVGETELFFSFDELKPYMIAPARYALYRK